MLNINDLWIGELLISKISGKIGRFEGLHKSGKVRFKTDSKIILISPKQLDLYHPEDNQLDLNLESPDKIIRQGFDLVSNEIDLHIEKLRPDLQNSLPERIIDIQIKSFEDFYTLMKENRRKEILVIHGKGAGVLKASVHSYIKGDKDVMHFELTNNGGATKILFY
jgi:hypothetical protein